MKPSFRFCYWQFAFIPILTLALSASSIALAQTTIHVPGDAGTIQAGIDAASNGDTVLVAPGTYTENIDFKGKAITVTSGATSYAGASATIIKAAGDGPVATFATGEPPGAVLNGFTIQNGHLNDLSSTSNGAGVYIAAASPTVTNNVVTANTCGIVVGSGGSGLIQGNDIKGNAAASSLYPTQYEACQTLAGNAPGGSGLSMIAVNNVQAIGNVIEENDTRLPGGKLSGDTSAISIYAGNQILLENNIVRNNIGTDLVGLSAGYTNGLKLQMIQNLFEDDEPVDLGNNVYLAGTAILNAVNNTFYWGLRSTPGGEKLPYPTGSLCFRPTRRAIPLMEGELKPAGLEEMLPSSSTTMMLTGAWDRLYTVVLQAQAISPQTPSSSIRRMEIFIRSRGLP